MLVMMGGIYELYHYDGLRWHDIHTKSHDDQFSHLNILRLLP
jgi:hypothetical protein